MGAEPWGGMLVFNRIANLIAKHYKLIIVLWVIALLPALYFAPKAAEVVAYEENQMAPADLPSSVAQEFIDQHFAGTGNQSTTIIVLTAPNVLDNASKSVVNKIEHAVFNESHGGRIASGVRADTIYSATQLATASLLMEMNHGYYTAFNMTNLTSSFVFGLPLGFQQLWQDTNISTYTIYGIPATHVGVWTQTNASLTIPHRDSLAYNQTLLAVSSGPVFQGMNATEKMLAMGWYNAYSAAWNLTAANATLTSDPALRANYAINGAFGPFIDQPTIPITVKVFLTLVLQNFNMGNYASYHGINAFDKMLFNDTIGMLFPHLTPEEQAMVLTYFDLFYSHWNSTNAPPATSQFQAMVGQSVTEFAALLPTEEAAFVLGLYSTLGWANWNNAAAISAYAINIVAVQTQSLSWVVAEVSRLPPTTPFSTYYMLSSELVQNHTIDHFPVPVLPALVSNFVNVPSNNTMILSLTYANGSKAGEAAVPVIRDIVRTAVDGTTGIKTYVTGSDAISADMQTSTNEDISRIDPVTILLVLVLIGLFFRSFVASSIPPMVIGIAVGLSYTVIFFLSYVMSVHYSVLMLLITSMLGAGCDYCIFVLSRYREERRKGLNKEEAVRTSVTWAGESIATSGLTVIIGFGVLSLGRFSMLQSMGIGLALGISIALLAALTLLPSVLMLLGDRVFWPARMVQKRRVDRNGNGKEGHFAGAARFAIRRAKVIVVAAVLISIPTTYLVFTLETSYDFIGAMPDTEATEGLSAMGQGFGAGKITPTSVALQMQLPVMVNGTLDLQEMDSIEALSANLSAMSNVQKVTGPTRPLGELINYRNLSQYPPNLQAEYMALISTMLGKDDTRAVLMSVTFKAEPFAKASIDTINSMRDTCARINALDPLIVQAMVGGATASTYDISNLVQSDFNFMGMAVVIGIYLVLMVVLGSIISPIRSIVTILLSISWTIATTMVVFQFIQGVTIIWMIPMVLLVMCLGLGMDYDIFITTRIREEVSKGRTNEDAIVHAMEHTGGVITACGIIMAGTFGSLMLSNGALLREFGFALMFAILLDATIVRIYLVPAIVSLLGKWNWYAPGRLQRVGREEKMAALKAKDPEFSVEAREGEGTDPPKR